MKDHQPQRRKTSRRTRPTVSKRDVDPPKGRRTARRDRRAAQLAAIGTLTLEGSFAALIAFPAIVRRVFVEAAGLYPTRLDLRYSHIESELDDALRALPGAEGLIKFIISEPPA